MELQHDFAVYQREQLNTLDRRMAHLLHAAVSTLKTMLHDPDLRCRDAACEKILRLHAKVVERIDVTGRVEVGPAEPAGLLPLDDLTPEQRDLARVLLQSVRHPKPLPPRLTTPDPEGG